MGAGKEVEEVIIKEQIWVKSTTTKGNTRKGERKPTKERWMAQVVTELWRVECTGWRQMDRSNQEEESQESVI